MSQYIGASSMMETNGGAPTAITPHTNTRQGDLLIWYHYSAVTGGNETVTPPTNFTTIFNFISANNGLIAAAWKIRNTGETTYTATITNHTSSTSGETVIEWIESWADVNFTTPISSVVSAISTWASGTNIGAISVTGLSAIPVRGTLVVMGGRRENVTSQTVLTGDNLNWTTAFLGNSSLGLDAGAVTQYGINNTTSTQTATSKTIATGGTAQTGAGAMFVLNPPPAGVVGGVWPESNSDLGPFVDGNGNAYTLSEFTDTPPVACMRKSHDGGDTWLEQNAGNRPTHDDLESVWMTQRGTVIHTLIQRSGTNRVSYFTFNTSDAASNPDTWQIRDEIVHTPGTAPSNQAVSLVVKANGDAYAFYRTAPVSTFQRLAYKKKPSGGAWGTEVQIDQTASTNFTQIQAQLGVDGTTIHILYKDDTNSKIRWKTLNTSTDTLQADPGTILNPSSTTSDDETMVSPPAILTISGTERVMTAWKRLSDSMLIGVPIDGGSPGSEETVSHAPVYEDPPLATSLQTVASLAQDDVTDKIYAVYADESTHDMWYRVRNGTWGTQTEILDGVDIQYISANLIQHSAGNGGQKVIGIVYDDVQGMGRGIPKYTEFEAAAAPPSGPPVAEPPIVIGRVALNRAADW